MAGNFDANFRFVDRQFMDNWCDGLVCNINEALMAKSIKLLKEMPRLLPQLAYLSLPRGPTPGLYSESVKWFFVSLDRIFSLVTEIPWDPSLVQELGRSGVDSVNGEESTDDMVMGLKSLFEDERSSESVQSQSVGLSERKDQFSEIVGPCALTQGVIPLQLADSGGVRENLQVRSGSEHGKSLSGVSGNVVSLPGDSGKGARRQQGLVASLSGVSGKVARFQQRLSASLYGVSDKVAAIHHQVPPAPMPGVSGKKANPHHEPAVSLSGDSGKGTRNRQQESSTSLPGVSGIEVSHHQGRHVALSGVSGKVTSQQLVSSSALPGVCGTGTTVPKVTGIITSTAVDQGDGHKFASHGQVSYGVQGTKACGGGLAYDPPINRAYGEFAQPPLVSLARSDGVSWPKDTKGTLKADVNRARFNDRYVDSGEQSQGSSEETDSSARSKANSRSNGSRRRFRKKVRQARLVTQNPATSTPLSSQPAKSRQVCSPEESPIGRHSNSAGEISVLEVVGKLCDKMAERTELSERRAQEQMLRMGSFDRFDGSNEQEFGVWFSALRDRLDHANVHDGVKLEHLIACLQGSARREFFELVDKPTWEEAVKVLLDRYSSEQRCSKRVIAFQSCRQRQNESAKEFAARLKASCPLGPDCPEVYRRGVLIGRLLDGLRNMDYKRIAARADQDPSMDFDRVVTEIVKEEEIDSMYPNGRQAQSRFDRGVNQRTGGENSNQWCTLCATYTDHTVQSCRQGRQGTFYTRRPFHAASGANSNSQQGRYRAPGPSKCYSCGMVGHVAARCTRMGNNFAGPQVNYGASTVNNTPVLSPPVTPTNVSQSQFLVRLRVLFFLPLNLWFES